MNNIANSTTLWQLLGKTVVVIPILQRDYAQGRSGYENLREKFLSSIIYALDNQQQLKLDFVYGSADGSGRFNPLDGQQRLTTLWLLHWYLAFRLGKLSDPQVCQRLSNFSYETRSSSTQFCQHIVHRGAELHQNQSENIADAIMRQTWIPSIWCQDPTVQAMLRMLSGERNGKVDGIEELFSNASTNTLNQYWEALMLPAANCPLVFYQLDLENLGQSDDLYVKMNGRGKPLSDYENFKADLVKYIADNNWKNLQDPTNGLPILLDTKWTDFFWNYRDEAIDLDDILFGFINRYFLVRLMLSAPKLKIEDKDLGNEPIDRTFKFLYSFTEDKEKRENYNQNGFGIYQTLFDVIGGFSALYDLRTIMDNISTFNRDELSDCVQYPYDDSEKFEFVYTSGKDNLYKQTIPETIAFWAVCRFFLSPQKYCAPLNLKHWMRIVWNVCNYHVIDNNKSVPEIRSKSALRSTIISLNNAFSYAWDAYNPSTFVSLEKSPAESEQHVSMHIIEEQEKVRQISKGIYSGSLSNLSGQSWESILISEEKLPIFEGTIRALIYNEDGDVDWSAFDTKYENLHWYLDKYNELNSVAYRNYLLHDFSFIKHYYWFPAGAKRNAFWRLLLAYHKNSTCCWLLTPPKDESALVVSTLPSASYERRSLIQTNILDESTHESGMYLAYSWTHEHHVFMHHQTSWPYVIFNEERDIVVNEAIKCNLITLENPEIQKKSGLFDARDILLEYQGELYNWHARGVLFKQSKPELQLAQPTSLASLLNAFIILNTIK